MLKIKIKYFTDQFIGFAFKKCTTYLYDQSVSQREQTCFTLAPAFVLNFTLIHGFNFRKLINKLYQHGN